MATANLTAEQRVTLHNVDWDTYLHLLDAHADASAPRFTYDRGELEIMSPSPEHEAHNRNLAMIVEIAAESLGIDIVALGSTTFQREELARGFEPDSCFYIQNEPRVRGKDRLDLHVDPPPDLVIEIDVTHPSLPKLSLFHEFGVPEIWQFDGTSLKILVRERNGYVENDTSAAFPGVTATDLGNLLAKSRQISRTAWLRQVRNWGQGLAKPPNQ